MIVAAEAPAGTSSRHNAATNPAEPLWETSITSAPLPPSIAERGPGGINAGLWHATSEAGPRTGVLTAIEDFESEADSDRPKLVVVPARARRARRR